VFRLDGLKTGGGIDGAGATNVCGAEEAGLVPCAAVAAWCALVRPDVFGSLVLMSAPFAGPPELPFNTDGKPLTAVPRSPIIHEAVAALSRPRKHYQWYYSTRPANAQMWHCRQAPARTSTRFRTGIG
jgi:pimeloyl-ACP methyl ester carboxylesterase